MFNSSTIVALAGNGSTVAAVLGRFVRNEQMEPQNKVDTGLSRPGIAASVCSLRFAEAANSFPGVTVDPCAKI